MWLLNPNIYHYYSWRQQGFLCLEFLTAEHGRTLSHLVTYTSRKREGNTPGDDTILLTTEGTKKPTSIYQHLQITIVNLYLFHLNTYRSFSTRAESLGESSPGTRVAQPNNHTVMVLGLGTCHSEAQS